MRPGLQLDEIALIHGIPPWLIDATCPTPGLRGRLAWRLRATAYRVGLRRLAALRLHSD